MDSTNTSTFVFGSRRGHALIRMDGGEASSTLFTGDRSILISDDGARQAERLHNITHKKRRVRLLPSRLNDSLAEWIPVNDSGCQITDAMDSISGSGTPTARPAKRKSYASSDEPMSEFPEVQQLYFDEIMHMHGLGYSTTVQRCALCEQVVGTEAPVGSGRRRFFRCKQCGVFHQCLDCCLKRHSLTPLHVLQEWTSDHWTDTTLHKLGLVYQLGHGGLPCGFPDITLRTLTVVDSSSIQEIKYNYCLCGRSDTANNLVQLLRNAWYPASKTDPDTVATFEVLDLYRLLNVVGNVNARDFIRSLERLTDATASTGMHWLPDTYKAFLRMSRQWAFLQRRRRAGRAYDPEGLAATKPGELTVACWPCPHDGRNLPANWRLVESQYRYLYRLILALDANFKLKNRIRKNEHPDPSLGPGWGAFVEPKRYKKHLRKGHIWLKPTQISTCIAFAALTQKETRNTAGLRVSGVGGCVCARHECIRPNGMGDLQKGERYANMDYILLSALIGAYPQELTVSYDIACQWQINFAERMAKLPAELQRDWSGVLLQSGLPVWHALAHECKNENNLGLVPGVGKTDGEGIERLWAILNGSAWQTKEMTLGNRADTLEDKLDSHNFLKNLSQCDTLQRRLIVALAERERQVDAFKEINKTIHSDKRSEWQTKIDLWLKDKKNPNPYVLRAQDGPSEADVRLSLKKEEQEAAAQGHAPLHATSATAFLTAGLQLEETQRRIRAETAAPGQMTADRQSKIEEQRMAFFAKLRPFRALQEVYTPGAVRMLAAESAQRLDDTPAPAAERVSLWLPSQLPERERKDGCQGNLPAMEAQLRESQCRDALVGIRLKLHAKGHLIAFRNANVMGQVRVTRSRSLIDHLGVRVDTLARKYTEARAALQVLKGTDYAPQLRKLDKADLRIEGEGEANESQAATSDRNASKKLRNIGGRPAREAPSGTTPVLSWIWSAPGALDDKEKDLHESLQVEWSKAKARKTRWEEEVELLREEMKRVVRYLEWEIKTWETRAADTTARTDITVAACSGLRGYALSQAARCGEIRDYFVGEWSLNLGAATDSIMTQDLGSLFEVNTDA
ncbi:hypothetical protein C8R47DRAFT_1071693 [Mycena vitilis]|nr:hypothetical protein C8R47DRAFT_1071693 [Mycena vitilis]